MTSAGLRYRDGKLEILDQTLLPDREVWLECRTPSDMVEMIRVLRVRGAPLIGVAAAVALGDYVEKGAGRAALERAAAELRAARPTAVNLMHAVDRVLAAGDGAVIEAERIFEEDVKLCAAIGANGAALFRDGDGFLTHCNAGALATAGIGTAVGVIRAAFDSGKKIHVYVDETRPLLQGARLTAWELSKAGIPYTLICDNMAAVLMKQGRIQRIVVGADRIAANGDFANKIGTYGVAVSAHHHGIPFYVAAPYTTVDPACRDGASIPVEQRAPAEVRGATGSFGSVRWSPESCEVFNPAFDVTPVDLVEAFILDTGVITREQAKQGGLVRRV